MSESSTLTKRNLSSVYEHPAKQVLTDERKGFEMETNLLITLNTICLGNPAIKLRSLIATVVFAIGGILTSPAYAFELLNPDDPPIPPVCIVDDSDNGGQSSRKAISVSSPIAQLVGGFVQWET